MKPILTTVKIMILAVVLPVVVLFSFSTPSTLLAASCSGSTVAVRTEEGLLSYVDDTKSDIANVSSTPYCVTGPQAQIDPNAFSKLSPLSETDQTASYTSIHAKYFANAASPKTFASRTDYLYSDIKGSCGSLNEIKGNAGTGNLTINEDITFSGPIVFFVNGTLSIKSNIDYGETDSTKGVVFIVRDDVQIDKSLVTKVNAFIVTYGQFCSAYDFAVPECIAANSETTPSLIINGGLISANTTKDPLFHRSLLDNTTEAAENINYQSKYLVILKDLFSQDQITWTEIE